MELVYLWVDGINNISGQGFNFSPRFECKFYDEYDADGTLKDDCKLEINPKEYTSIFPDNINITAIVGENGSGKSSVLLGITNCKAIFKIGNTYCSLGFDVKKINAPIDIKESTANLEKHIVYLDFDLLKINPIRNYSDYMKGNIYDKNLYKKIENNVTGSLDFNIAKFRENFYNLIIEYNDTFNLKDIFIFNPIEIELSDYISEQYQYKEEIYAYLNALIKNNQEKVFTKEKFLTFIYSQLCMQLDLKMTKIGENILSIEKEIIKKDNLFKIDNYESIYQLLNIINKNKMNIEEFNTIYSEHKNSILKLIEIGYLNINLIDSIKREYYDLSHGERKFFTESMMIFDAIKKNNNENILIVLDEPDLTFHPDWQKKYIKELINLLNNFPEKKFQIVITSHSPFILSDLPKENVIFLEKGEQKYPFKDKQTFGANIHTLLSDGFFMSDGLMGEFAKEKIEKIKKFYDFMEKFKDRINSNEKVKSRIKKYHLNRKEKFEHIQSIIGEPFLKTIMKNYLDELEQIFENENYKKNQIEKFIEQFGEDEVEKYLESKR